MAEPGADQEHREARILVVDDEVANVRLLEILLSGAGYSNVRSTIDSRTVVSTIADWCPDLVLLDLAMPSPDGFAILEQIDARPSGSERIPVLVLTADAARAARDRAFILGASDFVTKPFDRIEVILRIRNLLATRHLERALRDQNETLETRVDERTRDLYSSLAELSEAMNERQALVNRLITAQEEERRRIASDIHDDTMQTMVAAAIRIELLRRAAAGSAVMPEVDALAHAVREAITSLRNLLFDVHPAMLEREGLVPSLRTYLERMHANGGPAFRLDATPDQEPASAMRATIYRIAQEALANVGKHAAAGLVQVSLQSRSDGTRLRIVDDGTGFDPASAVDAADGHLGITTMRERAMLAGGICRIHSTPGGGTTVDVWFPAVPPVLLRAMDAGPIVAARAGRA
jgi:signal transduction histidine kinase